MNKIDEIANFHFPRWEELPDKPIFNREVVEYINETFQPILQDDLQITSTMIQNYSKWGVIPKIEGRKYGRLHIAMLIVITLFKNILMIEAVSHGIDLLLKHFSVQEGYDIFAEIFESVLNKIFKNVDPSSDEFVIEGFTFPKRTEGVHAIAYSYAFKLLGEIIISKEGYDDLYKE